MYWGGTIYCEKRFKLFLQLSVCASKITTILHLSNLYLPSEIRADGIHVDLKVVMILTCLLFPIGMIYSPCIFLHLSAIFRASVFCGVPRRTKLTVYVEDVRGY